MDDFSNYEQMRAAGATPKEVYLAAKAAGADFWFCIRLLRKVFNLDFTKAKEVTVVASGEANSLSEYQQRFCEPLREVLEGEEPTKENQ
jgi:hypothetical protein